MGFLETLTGGALDLGFDWLGNELISKPNADKAWDRTKDAYARRYQVTMADMKAAGLNPILAAGSGGFNVGQSPIAPVPQYYDTDASSAYASLMQGEKAKEEAKTERVEQLKKMAETHTEIARKYKVRAETGKASEEERRIWFEIEKIHSETIKNMRLGFQSEAEKKKIEAQTKQLMVELTRLKNVNTIYENPASMALSIIRELANSLGLNVGIIGKVGK